MNFELIIFDLDGVLVDSESVVNRILHDMLNELGINISPKETVDKFTGLALATCLTDIEKQFGKLPADFAKQYDNKVIDTLRTDLRPIDGIFATLENITRPICVASGSSHPRIKLSLEITGLLSKFGNNIFSIDDVARGKPAPDLFLHAAKQMGHAPQHCAVIEDSVPGVQAGKAAGMAVFAYTGSQSSDTLAKAGADHVFNNMLHLSDLLNSQLEARNR
jgi:HAD superfamily hydrolase (TIGR01509 family)